MAQAKWKVGLPKWRQKLTKELNDHLVDTHLTTPTLARFFSNRQYQKDKEITCWECEQIERKLNE